MIFSLSVFPQNLQQHPSYWVSFFYVFNLIIELVGKHRKKNRNNFVKPIRFKILLILKLFSYRTYFSLKFSGDMPYALKILEWNLFKSGNVIGGSSACPALLKLSAEEELLVKSLCCQLGNRHFSTAVTCRCNHPVVICGKRFYYFNFFNSCL